MANLIRIVKGDTRPQINVMLLDQATGLPIDVSNAGTSVQMLFYPVGGQVQPIVLVGTKLPGQLVCGSVANETQFPTPGSGGLVVFQLTALATSGFPGQYEGQVQVLYDDGTVLSVYQTLRFYMRAQAPYA
jgi:hypothetical protein